MPLVSIAAELKRAQEGGYAVPLFDTADVQSTEGMFQALEALRAPTIIGIYAGLVDQPNARGLAAYVRARAEDSPVPVSLMLDHGSSFEQCIRALHFGFTDVMIDGSKLPLEENIATTRQVVRAAHAVGALVEAELGQVGSGSDYQSFGAQRKGFTDPAIVERFVEETGVDLLAVAIGTAHGLYQGDPQVDLELLSDIRARVGLPLVLHGGTGCSEEQFRAVIRGGIAKINVATDLFVTAGKNMVTRAAQEKANYWELCKTATETFRERSEYYLRLFGTEGRA
ncbi:MAG TPA: class II fructose-bisphosphate aldolase [Armatimonadota bacterium]|jgi:fructose-bisphosphate aldolase class II